MIEATCSACGTPNRVPEASVPVGAKFITCAGCKARVALGSPGPAAPPPGRPPATPPAVPRQAAPPRGGGGGVADFADLPAPKRASALGAEAARPSPRPPLPAKPAGRSGLAAALDPDLPAPKAPRPPAAVSTSAPTLDLDEPMAFGTSPDDGIDLPAPKKPATRTIQDLARDDIIDLPAPKPGGAAAVVDLPTPKRSASRAAAIEPPIARAAAAPAPRPTPPIADLPAPKRGPQPSPVATRTAEPAAPPPGVSGLPAPKGFFDDLSEASLEPDGHIDLPAPKGFFEDLPGLPNPNRPELPAPKGFFDDLPQPALRQRPELPAPKGFFDDLPQPKSNPSSTPEVPAPKGYFEDIPGLPHHAKPELPAPQGFFDDIPGLPHQAKPELPVPQGHFENVPGRPFPKSDELAPKGFFDDLPDPGQPAAVPASRARKPSGPPSPADQDLELDTGPELDLVAPASATVGTFDDLDLSKPSPSPARFDPPSRGPSRAMAGSPKFDTGGTLELEGAMPTDAARPAPLRPAKSRPVVDEAAEARTRGPRTKLVLGGAALVVALGGAGTVLYQRHVAARERADAIAEQLAIARKAYTASDPPHWQRTAAAARRVLDLDAANPEALGLGAEALLASALADGTAAPVKLAQARSLIELASDAGIANPQLGRARALAALAAHQPDGALAKLQPLVTAQPKDATLALYLGWALAAKGDLPGAVHAYDAAAAEPAVKIAALYGRGNAKLEAADLEGAKADFAAVLELSRDHIGAQVGLAAAQPPSAAQQQESDLVAILARKDIATADPRVVARAWTLAGIAAARAGRTSVARERFQSALVAMPKDLAATTGLAETELADGKLLAAAQLTSVALNLSNDSVPAQLVQSEIELKQGNLPIAAKRLAALAGHSPPLAPLEQARLQLVTGRLLEAQGQDDAAVAAYIEGAKAAGDLDLAPLMAAVGKLAAMTGAAVAAKDLARANDLRAQSEQLLGELATQAARDPRLARTLGMAYLQQGDPEKAEPWLRQVVEARPKDAESRYQLGRALLKAGKTDAAVESFKSAIEQDASRSDIAVDLARAYEGVGRDADAGALYTKLLAGNEPSLELRARAGRYYARTGAPDKAGAQGAKLLEVDPHNAAGLYLKGEGMLAAGRAADARQLFQHAIDADRDPQYLDALGRAAEQLAQDGDRDAQDLALRSYLAAAEAVPPPQNSLIGQGRLYVARNEASKAIPPLLAANRTDPKNADVMLLIGEAYQVLQQAPVALQWLEASVRTGPRAEAFWRIGQLERDANQGARAAEALGSATRLASESEKRTGKPIRWLTDALYLQGRVNFDSHNDAGAREAWRRYVDRKPPASVQLSEVQQLLATSLR